jgi:hypothetical protein
MCLRLMSCEIPARGRVSASGAGGCLEGKAWYKVELDWNRRW